MMINRIKNTVQEMRQWGLLFPIKFKIAEIASQRNPKICWTDAATWAMNYKDSWQEIDDSGACMPGGSLFDEYCGGCYCGKHRTAEAAAAVDDAPF